MKTFFRSFLTYFKLLLSRGPIFIFVYFVESLWFDIRFGLDTSFRVPKDKQLSSISVDNLPSSNDGLLYVASFSSVLRRTISLSIRLFESSFPSTSFQFIDLGCGKGKSIFFFVKYFSDYLQRPVLGIEYDQSLTSVAIKNLSKIPNRSYSSGIICDSALNFSTYISSSNLIVYLYNSFQGTTLQSVINDLKSYNVVVIYVDPAESFRFESDSSFTLVASNSGRYNADTWRVYTNIPLTANA